MNSIRGEPWGNKLNFDMCLNTTNVSIKELAAAVAKLYES